MIVFTYRTVNSPEDRPAIERIATAARRLFAERGFAATSVREIAAAAKVTKPMVYYYFGSKNGLYERLLQDCAEDVKARLSAATLAPGDCRTKLERLIQVYAGLSSAPETLELLRRGGKRLTDLYAGAVGTVLAEGESRGESRPVDHDLFAASLCGALTALDEGRGRPARSIVDVLWRGLTRDAPP